VALLSIREVRMDVPLDVKLRLSKIQQQADRQSGRHEVIQTLSRINIVMLARGFQLNNDVSFHKQVGQVIPDNHVIVMDLNGLLLSNFEPSLPE
jgi:hypothetical protein